MFVNKEIFACIYFFLIIIPPSPAAAAALSVLHVRVAGVLGLQGGIDQSVGVCGVRAGGFQGHVNSPNYRLAVVSRLLGCVHREVAFDRIRLSSVIYIITLPDGYVSVRHRDVYISESHSEISRKRVVNLYSHDVASVRESVCVCVLLIRLDRGDAYAFFFFSCVAKKKNNFYSTSLYHTPAAHACVMRSKK